MLGYSHRQLGPPRAYPGRRRINKMYNTKVKKFLRMLDEETQRKFKRWVEEGLENKSFFEKDVRAWDKEVVKSIIENAL